MHAPAPSSPTTPTPGPRRRTRLLVLALAPLLGLGAAELILRAWAQSSRPPPLLAMAGTEYDYARCETLPELLDAVAYEHAPGDRVGDFVLNGRGLRTGEYVEAREAGIRRVVVLGDSHSFRSGGVPTPWLWDRRLAQRLAARTSTPWEFVNLSVPAVGPTFEQRMWELEGRRLRPDVVILALSLSNDLLEVPGALADRTRLDGWARTSLLVRLVRNTWLAARAQQDPGPWAPEPLVERPASRGPRVVGRAAAAVQGRGVVIPGAEARYDPARPGFDPATHERIVYARMAVSDRRSTAPFERAVEAVRGVLAGLAADVRDQGGRLVVLLIPGEHQVDDALFERVAGAHGRSLADFDRRRAQRALTAVCEELDVVCVDPLDAIREGAARAPMYRLRETHLSADGHALLAAAVDAALGEPIDGGIDGNANAPGSGQG